MDASRFNPLDRGSLYLIAPLEGASMEKVFLGFNPLDRGNLYLILVIDPLKHTQH